MAVRKGEPYGTALALARLYEHFCGRADYWVDTAASPLDADTVFAVAFADAAHQVRYEMERLGLRWEFRDAIDVGSAMSRYNEELERMCREEMK